MSEQDAKALDDKTINLMLENIMNNDWHFNGMLMNNSKETIKTSFDFALLVTKQLHDSTNHARINKLMSLYEGNDDKFADYVKKYYSKELTNLGIGNVKPQSSFNNN